MHSFDKRYWEQHWDSSSEPDASDKHVAPANPYVVNETHDLPPGNALDAGCGAGAEAIWLAAQGWRVTGADISGTALAMASERAREASVSDRVTWVEADLTSWNPQEQWDLVVTGYAHPAMPQLAFYQRIAEWVAPGGSLLIVGHLQDRAVSESGHHPPHEATATLADITAGLDSTAWSIGTAQEHDRTLRTPGGHSMLLRDVVVRATRRT